jgi:hypothetical protein
VEYFKQLTEMWEGKKVETKRNKLVTKQRKRKCRERQHGHGENERDNEKRTKEEINK